ncbi:hypothetical protein HMPREF0454_02793 [Hafnia alvei ATCC 51873]|uniref:Uncharacterized protein n=1 Tax=Hafnia alvei ATCC 51873 TaxID=1002364 RepID=G9Y884_HAFAL|nr:hypothetical protein F652_4187 [Enterobacteriaceae bacterium bta3-1]EHM41602.1 hypothetical protein HMPREF0454_02793 [Hafnia alvei ATCC 51873]
MYGLKRSTLLDYGLIERQIYQWGEALSNKLQPTMWSEAKKHEGQRINRKVALYP